MKEVTGALPNGSTLRCHEARTPRQRRTSQPGREGSNANSACNPLHSFSQGWCVVKSSTRAKLSVQTMPQRGRGSSGPGLRRTLPSLTMAAKRGSKPAASRVAKQWRAPGVRSCQNLAAHTVTSWLRSALPTESDS